MRIMLLGEFSSLHKYLKDGLKENGYKDVTIASNGDGWKNIPGADVAISKDSNRIFGKIYGKIIVPIKFAFSIKDYDIVQLINPSVFPFFLNPLLIRIIRKRNKKICLLAAGDDFAIVDAYKKGAFEYYSYDYDKNSVKDYRKKTFRGLTYIRSGEYLEKKADMVIPTAYEYWKAYKMRRIANLTKVIPFPINIDNVEYTPNIVQDKICFFHGLNRELTKGTQFIRPALEKLEKKYPNDVEVIIAGNMPFEEYTKVLKKANVVVDQCCTYGYGINACVSLAMGKVVMSGCRSETLEIINERESPIIEIRPNTDFIYKQLELIVKNKSSICEWGFKSREYVEKNHNYKNIARLYLEEWKK